MFAVIYIPDFSLQSVMRFETGLQRQKSAAFGRGRSGAPAERRKLSSSQIAALCRSAVTVQKSNAPDQRSENSLSVRVERSRRSSRNILKVQIKQTARSIVAAVVDPNTPQTPIFQLSQAARDVGVTEGMTAAQAMARCPDIAIHTRSESLERSAMEALLDCASGFSPDFEATADGVVTLDLKGFKNVSWEKYARKMVDQVRRLRLDAQVGVAGNPMLAFYAARSARPVLVIGETAGTDIQSAAEQYLSALPIQAIEPSPGTLEILKQWGIPTLGAFISLGREEVSERLGEEGSQLFERARAREVRPLNRVRLSEQFEEGIDFEYEIETAEPLLFVLRRFVEQLSVRMDIAGKAAEALTLIIRFSNSTRCEHVLKVPEPTSNEDVLFLILQTHLEQFKSEHTITGLRLSIKPCPGRSRQLGLFASSLRDPNRLGETLARLEALVGRGRAGSPVVLPTHRPDAFEMQPVNFEAASAASPRKCSSTMEKLRDGAMELPGGAVGLPLRRFRPPLPARVEWRDSRPVAVRTGSFACGIREARGPWRSSGGWWDDHGWWRDEWDVQTTNGSLYRLFRQETEWFVEGVYD